MDAVRRQTIHAAMVRLADGDRTALSVLLDDLWPALLSFAKRGVGNDADAEDVAQEVFVRICSRATDFDRSRDAVSWAFAIAGYEVLTHRRRVQRRREVFDEGAIPTSQDPTASQEELLLQREIEASFEAVLGSLSQADRNALGLVETKEVSSAGPALRKRKQRALERLREVWRRINGGS